VCIFDGCPYTKTASLLDLMQQLLQYVEPKHAARASVCLSSELRTHFTSHKDYWSSTAAFCRNLLLR
jgi:hypothetical protein